MIASFSFSTTGDHIAIPAVSGRSLLIYRIELRVSLGSNKVSFKSNATLLYDPVEIDRMSGLILGDYKSDPIFETALGEAFVINQTTAKPVSGFVIYGQN